MRFDDVLVYGGGGLFFIFAFLSFIAGLVGAISVMRWFLVFAMLDVAAMVVLVPLTIVTTPKDL